MPQLMSEQRPVELQNELRERIVEILQEPKFLLSIDHVQISEALMRAAFAWRDFNGGLDDTCHAAKCLHELVDEIGTEHNSKYSPEQLRKYVKKSAPK